MYLCRLPTTYRALQQCSTDQRQQWIEFFDEVDVHQRLPAGPIYQLIFGFQSPGRTWKSTWKKLAIKNQYRKKLKVCGPPTINNCIIVSLAHTYLHTHTHTLIVTQSYTHSHTPTYLGTVRHTYTHTESRAHSTRTHSHTHTLIVTRSVIHTHTVTVTHPHSHIT